MRTSVYIDGFNLFHGALRKIPYRWLDLRALSTHILPDDSNIVEIKYLTARVSDTLDDPTLASRQDIYLKALRTHIPNLKIYYGFFQKIKTEINLLTPISGKTRAKILKIEEKGSDVNLAVHLLNDAWHNSYDWAAVISNDSDLAESIRLVKMEHKKKIFLVTPSVNHGRSTSKKLCPLVDHVRHIDKFTLAKSQLPNPIPGTKIHKPEVW